MEAFHVDDNTPVLIQEYDGTIENARRFASCLRTAWTKVPKRARDSIIGHWKKATGAPFVWLLKDRNEWNGAGWAAASNGSTLLVVDSVAKALPEEHLISLLVHEFGHFLFVAEGDEHHCTNTGPDRHFRCEKLVWDLTATWGFEISQAELWMKQHFIDNKAELRRRDIPLPHEESEREFNESRAPILEKMAAFEFPNKYLEFCT